MPTLCSQDHFPWTNSVWHCARAKERSYERFAQLPSVLLDWSILSSALPLFSSRLILLSFAAKLLWVHRVLVNGLFVIVSALSAVFMERGCTGAPARILRGTINAPRTDLKIFYRIAGGTFTSSYKQGVYRKWRKTPSFGSAVWSGVGNDRVLSYRSRAATLRDWIMRLRRHRGKKPGIGCKVQTDLQVSRLAEWERQERMQCWMTRAWFSNTETAELPQNIVLQSWPKMFPLASVRVTG